VRKGRKREMITKMIAFLVLGVLLLGVPAVATNLVADGGFEYPVVDNGVWYQYYNNVSPPYWTLSGTGTVPGVGAIVCIIVAPGPAFPGRSAQEGSQIMWLSAWYGAGYVQQSWPTISQNIATTPGTAYEVSFWACTNPSAPAAGTAKMSFGSFNAETPLIPSYDDIVGGWQHFSYVTTASAASTTLSFTRGVTEVMLDNITVTAVPEPSSLLALAAGISPLACLALRRRQR
jgi:hypothetical protein